MRKGVLAFLTAMAVTGTVYAQGAGGQVVSGSKMLKVLFGYPAVAVEDDGTFRQTLDAVAKLDGRKCGKLEAFGWTYDSITKGEEIVDATMQAVQKSGFRIAPIDIKQFEGRQVFPSYAVLGSQNFLIVWTTQKDAATMVACAADKI